MTNSTGTKIVVTAAVVLADVVKEQGSKLTRARKDLFRFSVETSGAKVLRKIISENLRDLNEQIRTGKKGHKQKALVAARSFLSAQYTELMQDALEYSFTRKSMSQFIEAQNEKVLLLDKTWEEKKAEEASVAIAVASVE